MTTKRGAPRTDIAAQAAEARLAATLPVGTQAFDVMLMLHVAVVAADARQACDDATRRVQALLTVLQRAGEIQDFVLDDEFNMTGEWPGRYLAAKYAGDRADIARWNEDRE